MDRGQQSLCVAVPTGPAGYEEFYRGDRQIARSDFVPLRFERR
jgi:hypothetical protein